MNEFWRANFIPLSYRFDFTIQNHYSWRKLVRQWMMVVLRSNSNRGSLQILLRHPPNKIRKTTQGWTVNIACRWWAHLPYSTITGACSNLALLYVVACCVWCLAFIASNFVELHLLTLHIMLVNMTCVPVSRTYNICLSHHVLTSNYYCCVTCNNHLS